MRRGSLSTLLLLVFVECLVLVTIAFAAKPHLWIMVTQACVPFIVFGLVWRFPAMVSFGCEWADKYVAWQLAVFLITLTARVAYYYVNLLREAQALIVGCIAGAILCLAAMLLDPELSAKGGRAIFIWSVLVSIMYSYAVAFQINCVLDDSPAIVYRSVVLGRSHVSGLTFHPEWQMRIGPWGSADGAKKAAVPHRLFSTVRVGDTVCVVQRDGWLGMRWYTVQFCPWAGGPVVLGDVGGSH